MTRFHWHLIPIFTDNYVYVLRDSLHKKTLVVDPGTSADVEAFLEQRHWDLHTIFLTHHHHDHIDGCQALQQRYGCEIFGSESDRYRLPPLTRGLIDGEKFYWSEDLEVQVMAAPGHTQHHILYYLPTLRLLFCGDTLFSAGCGRLFEGSPQDMWASLQKIRQLPEDTLMACTHEYSLTNIKFARQILPLDRRLQEREATVSRLLHSHQPTVPTPLSLEKRINLFLRADDPALAEALQLPPTTAADQVFTALRKKRDLW